MLCVFKKLNIFYFFFRYDGLRKYSLIEIFVILRF